MTPPIVQFGIAYGAGLWVGLVVFVPAHPLYLLLIAGLLAALLHGWRRVVLLTAAVGFWTGLTTQRQVANSCTRTWESGRKTVMVAVRDAPDTRSRTTATVVHAQEACGGRVFLRVASEHAPAGATVVAVGEYRGRGMLNVHHARVLGDRRALRFRVREAVAQRIARLYGPRAGVVEALVLARRGGIDPDMRKDFTDAGLAHLLAISGLHVGVLAGWLVLVLRLLGVRDSAWLWSAALTWAYVGTLGFPASAVRAAGFLTIVGFARARQRHPPFSAVLAVAGLTILAIDPRAASSVGAWLSVAAVWGTRFGTELVSRPRLLGASLGATLATAPITAFVFGSVAPVGVIANLLAVPLAGVVVPGVFLSLVFGEVIAGGAGLCLALIERVAAVGSAVPGGHLGGQPGVTFALPWVGALAAVVWIRRRRPRWRELRRPVAAVAVVLWCVVVLPPVVGRDRSDSMSVHVLDVGQGDAIAVRSPRGAWVLVDAGPRGALFDAGRTVVVPFLRSHGVRELAAVVASHGDADHLGGVPAVIEAIPARLVLEPGQPLGTSLYRHYLATLDLKGVDWRAARSGDVFVLDSVRFDVLHPSQVWMRSQLNANENSVVLRVRYGCFVALLTGDIGWPAESLLASTVGSANVLKVGHHGSAGGTRARWLDAVAPDVAVVSVGRNRYGHPAEAVLDRLRKRAIPVFRTDRAGTVTIRTDGRYYEVTQGSANTISERLACLIRPLLRSNASFSSNSDCTPTRRVSLPACSTTSRSRPRSSPDTSVAPVSSTSWVRPARPTSRASSNKSWTF